MSVTFDIETGGLSREEILKAVPPFDRENVKLGNRKTPESIIQFMESAEEEYYERFVERAALDARTATVLCIGILADPWALLEGSEKDILTSFWKWWQFREKGETGPRIFVGFNILRFDLPFLIRRSWHLGIPVPSDVYDGRYFHRNFIDLATRWQMGNRDEMISLDALTRFLGLPPKKGNGKGFANLWENDREAAIEYLKNDLEITAQAAMKMGVL